MAILPPVGRPPSPSLSLLPFFCDASVGVGVEPSGSVEVGSLVMTVTTVLVGLPFSSVCSSVFSVSSGGLSVVLSGGLSVVLPGSSSFVVSVGLSSSSSVVFGGSVVSVGLSSVGVGFSSVVLSSVSRVC